MKAVALGFVGLLVSGGNARADDGFFRKVKLLGSSTGQVQDDNTSLRGSLGFSGENEHHYIYLLINAAKAENELEAGASEGTYGGFLLSPPVSSVSTSLRYRYFRTSGNASLGGFGQVDIGSGRFSAMVAGASVSKKALAVAIDAGFVGKLVLSQQKDMYVYGLAGLSMRALGQEAARDDALLMASMGSTKTNYFGVSASALLQLGDVFAGVQLSYFTGDVDSLSGAQFIPVVGLRGGFSIMDNASAPAPALAAAGSPTPPPPPPDPNPEPL